VQGGFHDLFSGQLPRNLVNGITKGPWNGKTQTVETNILKFGIPTMSVAQDRKMVWKRLWNPIQRVYKGVATTYFHANYPGTWSIESQRTLECPKPNGGNKYTQNWYSKE
jgi:hypothetical protein